MYEMCKYVLNLIYKSYTCIFLEKLTMPNYSYLYDTISIIAIYCINQNKVFAISFTARTARVDGLFTNIYTKIT